MPALNGMCLIVGLVLIAVKGKEKVPKRKGKGKGINQGYIYNKYL